MRVELANVTEIPDDGVKAIEFFGRPALLTCASGDPQALMNTCAHLGGPLEWKDGRLVCDWHGACFDAAGKRLSGPGGDRLMKLPTEVKEGVLSYVYGPDE